jgi:hypothetical protein
VIIELERRFSASASSRKCLKSPGLIHGKKAYNSHYLPALLFPVSLSTKAIDAQAQRVPM